MKTLAKLIVFILSITLANAQETKGQTITVTIDNVRNNNGKVSFALHTADTFMKGAGLQNAESNIENGKATVTFSNVASGMYAIMVLHDENENGRMDFQDNGMPKEDYGTSNNPMSYGPPQFAESKFEISNKDLEIKIRF
ncbi:MAG: DUF2141 domain-containing protein [Chlorobi bacterium]|nr:DUF2141 domain-containing protein [Chlorobiota bacterium]